MGGKALYWQLRTSDNQDQAPGSSFLASPKGPEASLADATGSAFLWPSPLVAHFFFFFFKQQNRTSIEPLFSSSYCHSPLLLPLVRKATLTTPWLGPHQTLSRGLG